MDNPPTILLVQGSFQTPAAYQDLTKTLQSLGYPTSHPELPTCSNTDSPTFLSLSLIDDALAVRLELTRFIEYERKTVMVVMHSYGGLVGTEAIPEELSYRKRYDRGLAGGVIHLFYFSAMLFREVIANHDLTFQPDGRIYQLNAERTLYNDLPPSEASSWASRLIPKPNLAFEIKLTRASYRYIASTYFVCENDQAAAVGYQEKFAATANAQVERCSAGYSPMLSQPKMLAERIVEVLKAAVAGLDGASRPDDGFL